MSNPYRPGRAGKNRPSRKPKIAGQDVALVRGLDRGGLMGRHLVTPENLGDSVRDAAKYLDSADTLEETRADYVIPRKSQTQKSHLKLFPTYADAETQIKTVSRTMARCACGHYVHTGKCETPHPQTGRLCQCRRKPMDAIHDSTMTVDGKQYPIVTVENTRGLQAPETTLLKRGIPFARIGETPRRGSHFPMVDPYTKQIKYSGLDVDETMPVFETETTYTAENPEVSEFIDLYATPGDPAQIPTTPGELTKPLAVVERLDLADRTPKPIAQHDVYGPACKHGLHSCGLCPLR